MKQQKWYLFLIYVVVFSFLTTNLNAIDFKEMTYSPLKTVFKVNAPTKAKNVLLRIYNAGEGGKAIQTVKMKKAGNDVWQKEVKGNLKGNF